MAKNRIAILRKLRDKLIVEEKFEVARDVAVICGVEVDVVWVAW